MITIRAADIGPQHMRHLIRVPTPDGPRDLMLVGHRRCDCGRTTVMSPGHRQTYVLLPDAQVEILADVRGGRP